MDVTLRPMRLEDADEVFDVIVDAFTSAASRAHDDPPEPQEGMRESQHRRVAHSVRHDAEGCWVAEADGRIVGAAIALLREDLWILSLLMVRGEAQGQGVGRRLMERALAYAEDRPNGIIAASLDPYAWRRYWGAGFRLWPAAMAKGRVDRTALPAVEGVREGRPDDYELCHALSRRLRGAAHGPDIAYLVEQPDAGFWVADGAGDRGYVITYRDSPSLLAADRPETARKLLWTALAHSQDEVNSYFLTADQDWALDVYFSAGLLVRPGTALFTRGELGPMWPYLPNGPFL